MSMMNPTMAVAKDSDSFKIDPYNDYEGNSNEIEDADPADAPEDTGVMIALLPIISDWCKIELPHMTLVYCGTTDKLKPTDFNELAKDASMLAAMNRPLTLSVQGVKKFGADPANQVLALDLQPTPQLWAMRRAVEEWNASEFGFDPHCTVGPLGTSMSYTPRAIAFDRIFVAWGEDNLTFNLNGSLAN